MNYALIFAGGVGSRMKNPDTPKQFIEVNNKPIIVHTLEHFQRHEKIAGIVVVCLKTYIDYMKDLVIKFNLSKVIDVVEGGKTGQESIFKGLSYLHGRISEDDVVLLHDGVRPIIDETLITNNIESVEKHGNAISVSAATETVCLLDRQELADHIKEILVRDNCFIARAPQSFKFKDIYDCHLKANQENYTTAVDSASMLQHYGKELFYVPCSHFNIKITTPTDLYLFKCYQESINK